MRFPIRYAHGNVLLGRGGEAAGLYRLSMSSYPFLATGEKWALAHRLERLAHTIAADFSLWRVNRAYPADQYVQHTRGLVDERHQDPRAWGTFLEGHRERLRTLDSHVPEVLSRGLARTAAHRPGSALDCCARATGCVPAIEDLVRIESPVPDPGTAATRAAGGRARIV